MKKIILNVIGPVFFALFCALASSQSFALQQQPQNKFQRRLLAHVDLAHLPEAKPLLVQLNKLIDSAEFKKAIENSHSLQLMRSHIRTTLFHLNFEFEVQNADYPYEPPYKKPFPFRPTVEAMDEAIRYLEIVEATTDLKISLKDKLAQSSFFKDLQVLYPQIMDQGLPTAVSKARIVARPVDTYDLLQQRLEKYGELAAFPEFEQDVHFVLNALKSEEVQDLMARDRAFAMACNTAISELETVKDLAGGEATRVASAFAEAFPYRRTIQAIVQGVDILDVVERLKYPEVTNWHEVEFSWHQGDNKKILALYHFNRYKYQMFGLLADKDVVLWPFSSDLTEDELFRLSAAPWGIIGVIKKVQRGDRHFNTPKDFLYHDVNHVRRILAYLKLKLKKNNALTREQNLAIYRQQEAFINSMLANTAPVPGNNEETEMRKLIRIMFFETFHETARPPDRDSMLYDLSRSPETRQPFEVQLQTAVPDIERLRTFDGNLKSGADNLTLSLEVPTLIRYFWDRAPGYLANIDNKLRWGFYDSVFKVASNLLDLRYRTPATLARAAMRLYEMMGAAPRFTVEQAVAEIHNRSGQPELWSYYSLKDSGVLTISNINALHVLAAGIIHDNWRRITPHEERWKPTDAKLSDGTIVSSTTALSAYLKQKGIPQFLHRYYKIDTNEATGTTVMFEDIRNLPNDMLAPNHQNENLMSGAKAVSVVDRIWHNNLHFKDLDSAERWLTTAAQAVHEAVLSRNTNGARNNPVLNQHWMLLPATNKLNDLELIRIGFEARLQINPGSLSKDQETIIRESIYRLIRKINKGETLRNCILVLTKSS